MTHVAEFLDYDPQCLDCVTVRWHTVHRNGAGELVEYPSGVLRGDKSDKLNVLLVRDGPMMRRWAALLSGAAAERGARNWMKASTPDDLERFRESAARHFEQWLDGELDEDHAAATIFNVNGVEYTKGVLGLPAFLPAV